LISYVIYIQVFECVTETFFSRNEISIYISFVNLVIVTFLLQNSVFIKTLLTFTLYLIHSGLSDCPILLSLKIINTELNYILS